MGGGGGVLQYFHTYVGSGHFWGFKILNFNNLVFFFQNSFFFWGGGVYENFVDIFVG